MAAAGYSGVQPLFSVLGRGQLALRSILFMFQLFKFFVNGQVSFEIMGKTKATNFLRLIAFALSIFVYFE